MIKQLRDRLIGLANEDRFGHYDVDGVSQAPDHIVIIASAALPGHIYQSCIDHMNMNALEIERHPVHAHHNVRMNN